MSLQSIANQSRSFDGVTVDLLHPGTGEVLLNDDKSPMTITVLGTDSPEYKNSIRRTQRENGNRKASAEKVEHQINQVLADCTVDWHLQIDGDEFTKFSKRAAVELYSNPSFQWLREQMLTTISDRSNFFR